MLEQEHSLLTNDNRGVSFPFYIRIAEGEAPVREPSTANGTTVDRTQPQSMPLVEVRTQEADEEQRLLRAVAHGEVGAFEQLWRRHQRALYRSCLQWMGGNPHEAKEALSRAALKVFHELPHRAQEISNYKCWLLRLTYNLCMDLQREHKRYTATVERLEDFDETHDAVIAPVPQQPEQFLLRQELGWQLQQAIARLPRSLREPFVLRFFEGLSCRDIAAQLALSVENVRKRLQRARALLRTQLSPYLASATESLNVTH